MGALGRLLGVAVAVCLLPAGARAWETIDRAVAPGSGGADEVLACGPDAPGSWRVGRVLGRGGVEAPQVATRSSQDPTESVLVAFRHARHDIRDGTILSGLGVAGFMIGSGLAVMGQDNEPLTAPGVTIAVVGAALALGGPIQMLRATRRQRHLLREIGVEVPTTWERVGWVGVAGYAVLGLGWYAALLGAAQQATFNRRALERWRNPRRWPWSAASPAE